MKKATLSKKLIILDRDGCVNIPSNKFKYVHHEKDFVLYDDVVPFILLGLSKGFKFAIATNQQGVAMNLYQMKDVLNLHKLFLTKINSFSVDIPIFVCPHIKGTCDCRKPKAGLLYSALEYHGVYSDEALFIGDSSNDAYAANEAKIDFVFLNRKNLNAEDVFQAHPVATIQSLLEFQNWTNPK